MSNHLNTILIPVDFSGNTEVAMSKALQFCHRDGGEITIHLLHVQRTSFAVFPYGISHFISGYAQQQINADRKNSSDKLEALKREIEKDNEHVNVVPWVVAGETVQDAIIRKAASLLPDLILIGKRSHHSFFPFLNTVTPSKLASVTGVPVLTVKQGSLNQQIRTVVIPVGHQFPASKLKILEAIRCKTKPFIRLVIFSDDATAESKQYLLNTFRTLKNHLSNPVNYEVLEGSNKGKALMKYCRKVDADMLIVYPDSETRVGSWINTHISDLIPAGSKTQVLAVRPA